MVTRIVTSIGIMGEGFQIAGRVMRIEGHRPDTIVIEAIMVEPGRASHGSLKTALRPLSNCPNPQFTVHRFVHTSRNGTLRNMK